MRCAHCLVHEAEHGAYCNACLDDEATLYITAEELDAAEAILDRINADDLGRLDDVPAA